MIKAGTRTSFATFAIFGTTLAPFSPDSRDIGTVVIVGIGCFSALGSLGRIFWRGRPSWSCGCFRRCWAVIVVVAAVVVQAAVDPVFPEIIPSHHGAQGQTTARGVRDWLAHLQLKPLPSLLLERPSSGPTSNTQR